MFLLHHVTLSINSVCHCGGGSTRPTRVANFRFGVTRLGEGWHNNHHAFPTSARHGLRRWQIDPGAWLISALERCHLAWDVIRISPARQQDKRVAQVG